MGFATVAEVCRVGDKVIQQGWDGLQEESQGTELRERIRSTDKWVSLTCFDNCGLPLSHYELTLVESLICIIS